MKRNFKNSMFFFCFFSCLIFNSCHPDGPEEFIEYHTITYNLNGGTNNSENPSGFYETDGTIMLKPPIKKGYDFLGWYLDSGYNVKITEIKTSSIKRADKNISLYAKWG